MGIKKRRISCWFQVRWNNFIKIYTVKVISKTNWQTWVKVKKVHTVLLFWKIIFWIILALFAIFEVKHRRNGSKKTKNLFYKCVLEFNSATINGLGEPSCSNRCTLLFNVHEINILVLRAFSWMGSSTSTLPTSMLQIILIFLPKFEIRMRCLESLICT